MTLGFRLLKLLFACRAQRSALSKANAHYGIKRMAPSQGPIIRSTLSLSKLPRFAKTLDRIVLRISKTLSAKPSSRIRGVGAVFTC